MKMDESKAASEKNGRAVLARSNIGESLPADEEVIQPRIVGLKRCLYCSSIRMRIIRSHGIRNIYYIH